jgi:hypothetical protein
LKKQQNLAICPGIRGRGKEAGEIETLLRDLETASQGAAAFRFVSGRYGSGKSFFLQAVRNFAIEKDFLVADADLSPEKRLAGPGNQGLETCRELLERLSTKVRPSGGALEPALQKRINSIRTSLIAEGFPPVGEIITGENWYEYLKLFAAFSVRIGFLVFLSGLYRWIDSPWRAAFLGRGWTLYVGPVAIPGTTQIR